MTEEKKSDAMAEEQAERLKTLERIARKNEREPDERAEEEEPAAEKVEAPAEAAEAAPEAAPEAEAEPDLSRKVTRKVNGVEVTKTVEEWIAAGQKVEASDRYLAEASKAFKVTRPADEAKAEVPKVEEDDLALARAIQTGTEEEARAAIARLRKQQPQAIQPEQLRPLVDERIAALEAARQFQSEFKDVVSDPYLFQLAQAEDAKLIQSGYQGSNLDRFRAAGTAVRKWRESLAGQASEQKQQRKASVTVIPTASARAAGKQEEPDESPADTIRQMAAGRRGR